MSALPTAPKHVLSSPVISPSGPPPSKRIRPTPIGTPANHFKRAPVNSAAKLAGFPEFPDGDVEIVLPTGKRYQLHRAILTMNSQFFRTALSSPPVESAKDTPAPTKGAKRQKAEQQKKEAKDAIVKYRFRIQGKGQEAMLVLQDGLKNDSTDSGVTVSESFNSETAVDDLAAPATACFNCGTPLGDCVFWTTDVCPSCEQPHPSDPSGFDHYLQNAYENLFLIYYNFAPTYIYHSKAPSEKSFFRLVEVARKYGSVRPISTRLDHDMMELGDTLWLHIYWEPIPWLYLSLQIRSQAIFREASIHIIGRGVIISQLDKIQAYNIPTKVITMLQRKYNSVVRMGHVIERQIRAINYPGDPTLYLHEAGDSTNWLALSLFRSFDSDFSARVYGRDQASVLTYFDRTELNAEYFRLYHTGGESYLNEGDLHHFLSRSGYFAAYEPGPNGEPPAEGLAASGFRRDLLLLKECARDIVNPICINESRLSVKELQRRGGHYLTCVSWQEEELPWWGEDEAW